MLLLRYRLLVIDDNLALAGYVLHMADRTTRRAPRGEGHLLRDEILDAAIGRMAAGEAAADISVRQIAGDVGKTVPALYQHFASKDALLVAAAARALDDMALVVGEDVSRETDIDTRLRRRAHAFVNFAVEHPVPYRLLFMTPSPDDNSSSLDIMMASVGFNALVADLADARNQGQMIDRDPTAVAIVLWTALHGVASLLIAHPRLTWPPDLLDQVLDQHAFGLAPR